MKPHISLITLGVKNVQESTEFYNKIGFPIDATGDITFIKMPNIWLALFGLEDLAKDANVASERNGFPGFTIAHNVISEEQVNSVINELREKGVEIVDEPHKRDWGGYSGYFKDLDGYLWEVAYNPFSPEIAVDENGI